MVRSAAFVLGVVACVSAGSAVVLAQGMTKTSPPTFQGDPDVYKVIFEDANFRVIEGVRKKGVHDKPHGHPLPSIVYFVTDCKDKLYSPDGKSVEKAEKAGTAHAVPIIATHSTENVSDSDCKQIFVERK